MKRTLLICGMTTTLLFSCSKTTEPECDEPGSKPTCAYYEDYMPYPADGEVHAVGVYEGDYGDTTYYYCDDVPYGDVQIDVNIDDTSYILVLCAYDPVRWTLNFQNDDVKNNMRGILLSGYHCQDVVNLPDSIPIKNDSHDAGGSDYFYNYKESGLEYNEMEARIISVLGKEITYFRGQYSASQIILN